MGNLDDTYQNHVLELRRGSIMLAIAGVLHRDKHYGYSLLEALKQAEFSVEGNTLYPLLRRLESQGILESSWDTSESRPRKYYSLTQDGELLYQKLLTEWSTMNNKISAITKEQS